MTDQESLREEAVNLARWIIKFEFQNPANNLTGIELQELYAMKILELVTQSNKALLDRIRSGLPERKILPTVQEQYAHPIIRMKEAEQAEFNRALDQVTALLDKELEQLDRP